MSVIEILTLIFYTIPYPIWIIILAGIIGYIILEVKEINVKNTEKIKDKETL